MRRTKIRESQAAAEIPATDYRRVPECPHCGGHSDRDGHPYRGYLEIPVYERDLGGWVVRAYACNRCAFGERLHSALRMKGLQDLREPYPRGLDHRDLHWLCFTLSPEMPTLLDAAYRIRPDLGRDRIIAAVQAMMEQDRFGSLG